MCTAVRSAIAERTINIFNAVLPLIALVMPVTSRNRKHASENLRMIGD